VREITLEFAVRIEEDGHYGSQYRKEQIQKKHLAICFTMGDEHRRLERMEIEDIKNEVE